MTALWVPWSSATVTGVAPGEKRAASVPRARDLVRRRARLGSLRLRRGVRGLAARPREAPVFVLGHQKSGTSAVAALLAELTGSSAAIDLFEETRSPAIDRVVRGEMSLERYLRRNRLDFSRQIVKEASLTFLYPQLAARFPGARFVFVVREPLANLKSVLDRLGLPGDLERLSEEQLAAMPPGWRLVFDPGWLGLPAGSPVELLAGRWRRCAETYLASPHSFHLVRYDDFRAAKLTTLEALAGELGLEPRNDISARLDVQFQPAGDRSVPPERFFGAAVRERVERICGEPARRLGYRVVDLPPNTGVNRSADGVG